MDFYVIMTRPGFRVAKKKRCAARIGKKHRITKEDTMKWFVQHMDGTIR
jgi:large subunit ribosomal protein L11e